MSFYSPDGLGLPMEMAGRFLFRQTWELGLDWEDSLSMSLHLQRNGRRGHIRWDTLATFTIPRSIGSNIVEIHIFCDASGQGYGAAAYAKTELGTSLVYAKGKIVKSISQTIPMLELEACVVGFLMVPKLQRVYQVDPQQIHFHTDAEVALNWIKSPGRDLPRPIARRSTMIRESTVIENWHFVPTDVNPADILSRGCKAVNLVDNKLWWHGPPYLKTGILPPDNIKAIPHIPLPDEQVMQRMVGIFTMTEPAGALTDSPTLPTLFLTSGYRRGCRVMFNVRFFLSKLRKIEPPPRSEQSGLEYWIKMDQIYHFPTLRGEILKHGVPSNREFASLFFEVIGGVLTVSGRLRKPGIPLLHKDSLLAKLWLTHIHQNVLHHAGGAATLKAEATAQFWVWKGTNLYKTVVRSCRHCTRLKTTGTIQQMAPLPHYRFSSEQHTAFVTTGLDFAGPWYTDQGRCPDTRKNLPRKPRYLLVFACLTFRAVHLEMTHGHTTQDVLEALQRFASRRRIPAHIISDNARELKKAAEVLTNCSLHAQVTQPICSTWGEVKWTFSHPRAPHTNGATESMVGVAKRAIKHTMPKHNLTDSLLQTVFTYCEDIANRRPLTTNPTDIHDPPVLTPGHFLGPSRGPMPPIQEHGPKNKFTQKWIQVVDIRDKFYKRFQRELSPELEKRGKWWDVRPAPKEGDIVCVLEHKLTDFGHWPIGRILETYSGRDGLIRSALVKLQDTVLRRNLRHLIPLSNPQTHHLDKAQEVNTPESDAPLTEALQQGGAARAQEVNAPRADTDTHLTEALKQGGAAEQC